MDINQIINKLKIAIHEKKMVKIIYINYHNKQTERFIKEIKFSKKFYDINKNQCTDSQFNYIEAFCILKNQIRTFKINRILYIDDGKDEYPYVKIGNQLWMTENLNVSRFRNGELIIDLPKLFFESGYYSYPLKKEEVLKFEYHDISEKSDILMKFAKIIKAEKERQFTMQINEKKMQTNENNEKKYGKLYNWLAVNDPRGLAPVGWRIPSLIEWEILIDNLAKNKKSTLINNEIENSIESNNHCGFDAKFSGLMNGIRQVPLDYGLSECGCNCSWWTSTICFLERSELKFNSLANAIKLYGHNEKFMRYQNEIWQGMSVRCIKDK